MSEYRLIPLRGKHGKGKFAKVSPEDFDFVSQYLWTVTTAGYATNRKLGLMHRAILKPPQNVDLDHRDHDTLNNQRDNLRPATPLQNARNRMSVNQKMGWYKGIIWDAKSKKWRANIRYKGKTITVGLFVDPIEAAKTYDACARFVYGEFANPNFVGDEMLDPIAARERQGIGAEHQKSSYIGVLWDNRFKRWFAQIRVDGVTHWLGSFPKEEDAARAYDACARFYRGVNTKANFEGSESKSSEQVRADTIPKLTSRFRGVHWNKGKRKWEAMAYLNAKLRQKYVGSFENEEEAARAVDAARIAHGLPPVNFP